MELIGGWPGSFAAQKVFHHKSTKPEYQTVYWSIVGAHVVAFAVGGKKLLTGVQRLDINTLTSMLNMMNKKGGPRRRRY